MRFALSSALFILSAFSGFSWAVTDRLGTERFPVWRSSRTCATADFALISGSSLTPVHFHSVVIESPTASAESYVSIYNSSTTNIGGLPQFFASTAALVMTNAVPVREIPPGIAVGYDLYLSSGMVMKKVGNACINILWDYVTPSLLGVQALPVWRP